jgi:hypothetical protein
MVWTILLHPLAQLGRCRLLGNLPLKLLVAVSIFPERGSRVGGAASLHPPVCIRQGRYGQWLDFLLSKKKDGTSRASRSEAFRLYLSLDGHSAVNPFSRVKRHWRYAWCAIARLKKGHLEAFQTKMTGGC